MVSPDRTLGLASRVTLSPGALVQVTGKEAIVLDTASERYFGLNQVGARLWDLLQTDPALAAAHRQLLQEFEVEPARLELDMLAVVTELADAGLVTIA
jgi:hypothetical protein